MRLYYVLNRITIVVSTATATVTETNRLNPNIHMRKERVVLKIPISRTVLEKKDIVLQIRRTKEYYASSLVQLLIKVTQCPGIMLSNKGIWNWPIFTLKYSNLIN